MSASKGKYRLLILFIFFSLNLTCHGQAVVDSLKKQIIRYEQDSSYWLARKSAKFLLAEARKSADKGLLIESYLILARNSYKVRRTAEALKYYKLYVLELEDQNNAIKNASFSRQKSLYENEVKALLNQIEEKDDQIQALETSKGDLLKKGDIVYYGLIIVFTIALLLFIGWAYNRYNTKQNKKIISESDNDPNQELEQLVTNITDQSNLHRAELDLNNILVQKTCPTPEDGLLKLKYVRKSFVFWQPKTVVTGDQLWVCNLKGYLIIAIYDVPLNGAAGSLFSTLLSRILTRLVVGDNITAPPLLLNQLERKMQSIFPAGMPFAEATNIGICSFDASSKLLTFSGANVMLFAVKNHQLIKQKGESKAMFKEQSNSGYYSSSVLEIKRSTRIYLSTNGFWDQIGGHEHVPFGQSTFVNTLQAMHSQQFDEQKNILSKMFNEWKGSHDQSDDVLVAGFEF